MSERPIDASGRPTICPTTAKQYVDVLFPFPWRINDPGPDSAIYRGIAQWRNLDRVFCWPPNLFAAASNLLEVTDAYKQTVCLSSPGLGTCRSPQWPPTLDDFRLRLHEISPALAEAWKCVITWIQSHPHDSKNYTTDPRLQWLDLLKECGRSWARHLNNELQYDEPIELDIPPPPLLPLTNHDELQALYDRLGRATSRFYQLATEDPLQHPEKEGPLRIAARVLCIFWDVVLRKLAKQAPQSSDPTLGDLSPTDRFAGARADNPDGELGIHQLHSDWLLFVSLYSLHAIADEAALGWGTHKAQQLKDNDSGLRKLLFFVENLLDCCGTVALTSPERCRVLPKRHTPLVGMTLRNLSLNLAFHQSAVEVRWHQEAIGFGGQSTDSGHNPLTSISVLLLPWPLQIDGRDFRSGLRSAQRHYFYYDPEFGDSIPKDARKHSLRKYIEGALRAAGHETQSIHMAIFPELSLATDELEDVVEPLLRAQDPPVHAYVAGVRNVDPATQIHRNVVYCRTFGPLDESTGSCLPAYSNRDPQKYSLNYGPRDKDTEMEIQLKHHRWCLEKSQIGQYQLGGVLSPQERWWEGIELPKRRSVRFINIGGELTLCPLICEDLARQEPIGDLIRAVGPSMVVAILLDGPQVPERWSARYASVLADDPGSAVITLTSVGMLNRCESWHGKKSRAIALWCDSGGPPRAIELEPGANAILLSVAIGEMKERAADGREDGIATNRAILGGVHQLRVPMPRDIRLSD